MLAALFFKDTLELRSAWNLAPRHLINELPNFAVFDLKSWNDRAG